MVVSDTGRNRIRDLVVADITTVQLGTDGTAPTVGDTDLIVADATTDLAPVVTVGNKLISVSHVVNSALGNGTTYKEGAVYINSILLDRFVYPDFLKSSSVEMTTIDVVRLE